MSTTMNRAVRVKVDRRDRRVRSVEIAGVSKGADVSTAVRELSQRTHPFCGYEGWIGLFITL